MKLLRSRFIAFTILTFVGMVSAAAENTFPDDPLLPGTKVVAGNSRDEFFIVADNDVVTEKKPLSKINKKSSDNTSPPIMGALNKTATSKVVHDKAPVAIRAALSKAMNKPALKKLAITQTTTEAVATKKMVLRLKTALDKLKEKSINKLLAPQTKTAFKPSRSKVHKQEIFVARVALYKPESKKQAKRSMNKKHVASHQQRKPIQKIATRSQIAKTKVSLN